MIRRVLASTRSMSGPLGSVGGGGGGTPPYLAGGAPEPLAVYAPMLASSLGESYLRVAGTGGNANLDPAVVGGVAPTHAPGTGWGMNGTNTYLRTGINPGAGWAVLCRFSDLVYQSLSVLFGVYASGSYGWAVYPYFTAATTTRFQWGGGQTNVTGGQTASGTLGFADITAYRNGISLGGSGTSLGQALEIFIGCRNSLGSPGNYTQGNIQYFIIYPTSTDHATWMPAVSAAVAAL